MTAVPRWRDATALTRREARNASPRWRGGLDDALRRRRREDKLTHWLISTQAPGGRRLERQARKDLKERQQDLDRACTELEEAQEQLELQLEEGNEAPPLPGGR